MVPLDTMGIQDPSFSARARARTPSRTRTRTRTRTRLAQYGTHLRLLHAQSCTLSRTGMDDMDGTHGMTYALLARECG